jgi:hypothetical protein
VFIKSCVGRNRHAKETKKDSKKEVKREINKDGTRHRGGHKKVKKAR